MKKINKKTTKKKLISELAAHFKHELDEQLAITVLPNGSSVYKDYVIKQLPSGNWAIFYKTTKQVIDQFFLKSCALLAAKAYSQTQLTKFHEVKRLDNQYWASYCDNLVYKQNIKSAKEFERYVILLNKLEDSESKAQHYKEEISRMFKWSFA